MIRFPPKRILVAVDLSRPSAAAWWHASLWAKRFGARLKAVHVQAPPPLDIPSVPQVPGGNRAFLRDLSAELRRLTGGPPADVLEGDPVVTLLRVIRSWKPDLVAMGTHGRAGLQRLVLGSVAEALMNESPVPVLAVHDEPRAESEGPVLRAVLAPVNFTPYSDQAFLYAAALAAGFGAKLTLQHLLEGEPWDRARASEEELIGRLPLGVREACEPRALVSKGPVVKAIAKAAEGHDLVVLSAHRRGLVQGSLFGTTAQQLLRSVRTPLLAVPQAPAPAQFQIGRWAQTPKR
ncbi:MAG: universal stress protein [Elusimicrobia bacterium]|nr:universal stress protein [Elusimicrobiota bacterium]